jgi:dimethylamine/trimethylamine dehydrogenase
LAEWSQYTLEQPHILRKLLRLGVILHTHTHIKQIDAGRVLLASALKPEPEWGAYDGAVLVSNRVSNDALYRQLKPALTAGKLDSLRVIGDAEAPNIIAQAVFSGHLAAQQFEAQVDLDTPDFRLE